MKIHADDNGSILLEDISPFLLNLLGHISERASSSHPAVEARFFPDPASEENLIKDWKSFVQPELLEAFQSARATVQMDLRGALKHQGVYTIQIPAQHGDAWLSALNQARLAISEESDFCEKDLSADIAPDLEDPRAMKLFQIRFYGFLQECLIRMQD